jgi:hypothetical protein
MTPRKLAWLLAFIILAPIGATSLLQYRPTVDDASRLDHFRIVGTVEFEGERISYNEIVQIRISLGMISTVGLKKGDNHVGISRLWIARILKGGDALLMEVPDAAGLFTDLERTSEPPDSGWTEQYMRDYLRPPPEFLPAFFWVDDAKAPRVMEGYVSETYYQQSSARLRIVEPIRIEFVPPTREADETAWQQARAEPHIELYKPGELSGAWSGIRILRINEDEWTQWPDVAPAIASAIENGVDALAPDIEERIFHSARRLLRWGSASYERRGVPQSKFAESGWGMLYRADGSLRADATVPAACDWTTMTCTLAEGQGYHILYKRRMNQPGIKIMLAGRLIDLRLGMVAMDRDTSDIFLVGLASR